MQFLGFPRVIHEQLSIYPRSCINSSQIIQGSDDMRFCRPLHSDVFTRRLHRYVGQAGARCRGCALWRPHTNGTRGTGTTMHCTRITLPSHNVAKVRMWRATHRSRDEGQPHRKRSPFCRYGTPRASIYDTYQQGRTHEACVTVTLPVNAATSFKPVLFLHHRLVFRENCKPKAAGRNDVVQSQVLSVQ